MQKTDKWTRDEDTRFTMRIDSKLLQKIKNSAQKNKRSTAKEIAFVLEAYYCNAEEE